MVKWGKKRLIPLVNYERILDDIDVWSIISFCINTTGSFIIRLVRFVIEDWWTSTPLSGVTLLRSVYSIFMWSSSWLWLGYCKVNFLKPFWFGFTLMLRVIGFAAFSTSVKLQLDDVHLELILQDIFGKLWNSFLPWWWQMVQDFHLQFSSINTMSVLWLAYGRLLNRDVFQVQWCPQAFNCNPCVLWLYLWSHLGCVPACRNNSHSTKLSRFIDNLTNNRWIIDS